MADEDEVRRFMADCCTCTGRHSDFVQASVLADALVAWRRDHGLPAWTTNIAARRLKDVVPEWRDPITGIKPYRHKASVVGYLGLVLRGPENRA